MLLDRHCNRFLQSTGKEERDTNSKQRSKARFLRDQGDHTSFLSAAFFCLSSSLCWLAAACSAAPEMSSFSCSLVHAASPLRCASDTLPYTNRRAFGMVAHNFVESQSAEHPRYKVLMHSRPDTARYKVRLGRVVYRTALETASKCCRSQTLHHVRHPESAVERLPFAPWFAS